MCDMNTQQPAKRVDVVCLLATIKNPSDELAAQVANKCVCEYSSFVCAPSVSGCVRYQHLWTHCIKLHFQSRDWMKRVPLPQCIALWVYGNYPATIFLQGHAYSMAVNNKLCESHAEMTAHMTTGHRPRKERTVRCDTPSTNPPNRNT